MLEIKILNLLYLCTKMFTNTILILKITKIVDNACGYEKRLISEVIHIKCNKNTINKEKDIQFLRNNDFPLLRNLMD